MTNAEELALSCVGAPSAFIESMVAGYSAIFESDAANPQGGNETVPVNTQNVVGSEEASSQFFSSLLHDPCQKLLYLR